MGSLIFDILERDLNKIPCCLFYCQIGFSVKPHFALYSSKQEVPRRMSVRVDVTIQGVVTPIGAVLTAEIGDTTRSPERVFFFLSVTGSLRFCEVSRDPLECGVIA